VTENESRPGDENTTEATNTAPESEEPSNQNTAMAYQGTRSAVTHG
jgi:hypothetical protein